MTSKKTANKSKKSKGARKEKVHVGHGTPLGSYISELIAFADDAMHDMHGFAAALGDRADAKRTAARLDRRLADLRGRLEISHG
jgi:hypothetical protein